MMLEVSPRSDGEGIDQLYWSSDWIVQMWLFSLCSRSRTDF